MPSDDALIDRILMDDAVVDGAAIDLGASL